MCFTTPGYVRLMELVKLSTLGQYSYHYECGLYFALFLTIKQLSKIRNSQILISIIILHLYCGFSREKIGHRGVGLMNLFYNRFDPPSVHRINLAIYMSGRVQTLHMPRGGSRYSQHSYRRFLDFIAGNSRCK